MINMELPIYWQEKKDKTVLVSMNKYRNYPFFTQNRLKRDYHNLIKSFVLKQKFEPLRAGYEIRYKLYYKNSNCDMANIISMIDKFFNDALKENGIIADDNVKIYKKITGEVAGQDKQNPRVEIEVKEIEEWQH